MPAPPHELKAASKEYEANGVVRIPSVFTRHEVDLLRSAATMVLTRIPKINDHGYRGTALETVGNGASRSPSLVFWPSLADPFLEDIRSDPRLVQVVSHFLGPDVKQLNNQIYYRLPGDKDSFAWHQDIMFRTPRDQYPDMERDNGYLQTALIIDEITRDNSPIVFVLGSHRLGDLHLVSDDNAGLRGFDPDKNAHPFSHLPRKAFNARPGDLLLWSALTVHGSAQNASERSRMYYMNGFGRSKNTVRWPDYLKEGRLAPLDPTKIP